MMVRLFLSLLTMLFFTDGFARQADTLKSHWLFTHKHEKLPESKGLVDVIEMVTPEGEIMPYRIMSGPGSKPIRFGAYILGKFYEEEEALKLNRSLIAQPGLKFGFSQSSNYVIPEAELSSIQYIIWFGDPPPFTEEKAKEQALHLKFSGRTIAAIVLEPSFSPITHAADGFIIEYNHEIFQVDVQQSEAARLMKRIGKGDFLLLEISNVRYYKGVKMPIFIIRTLIKDGEKLVQKGSVQI